MELGGYTLPAGTTVAPCVYLIHRDESVYPRPRSFVPERFLERPPGTYTWIPFGGGVRRCLAASYAELEMKRVLRTVLAEVELRPVGGDSERVTRSAISFSPDKRARVVAEPRARVEEPWQREPIYS
jgi:cytochrome P450